ncbi:MAG TPA: aryl-sulfate sulfotransferase [Myxococcota bacterium]|nr:aryl-sulfate sulfotransferase [Myxococcota bacterium]
MIALFLACQTPTTQPEVEIAPVEPAAKGTTMLAINFPVQEQRLVELDAEGEVVWQFVVGDELTFNGDGELPGLLSSMEVLPSGNVLFTVFLVGVFEIDREGEIVWEHRDPGASHDVDRLANGNTLYARTWAEKGEPQVVEIDPEGEVVWSWDGLSAYGDHMVFGDVTDEAGGWMHVNDVARAEDGTTMVVIRNFNKIVHLDDAGAVVDVFTFRSQAGVFDISTRGPVDGERPHGVEWLGAHHFVAATRRPHRIVEVNGRDIVWSYTDARLAGIRDVDRLPDGNTLLVAAEEVVELDDSGAVVWEWTLLTEGLPEDINPIPAISRIAADGTVLDRD